MTRYGFYEWLVMPFSITNAQTTFCTLINNLLHPYLDKFMVVYIDDIVVYNNLLEEYVEHVKIVQGVTREQTLVEKRN